MLDEAWMTRVARAHAQGFRKAVMAETEAYHARFELPALRAGLGEPEAIERAARMADEWIPLLDRALMAAYRRQQELGWTEHLVEHIETALEDAGVLTGPERVPAMVFLDLVGYTRLTEERGDQLSLAALAVLNLAGNEVGRILSWILQPILLIGGGLVTFRQAFVRSVP
jgi:hypothetical protein